MGRWGTYTTRLYISTACVSVPLFLLHPVLPAVFTAMILLFVTERRRRRTSRVSSTLWGGGALEGAQSEVFFTGTRLLCDWRRPQSPGVMCGEVLAMLEEGQHLVVACLFVQLL